MYITYDPQVTVEFLGTSRNCWTRNNVATRSPGCLGSSHSRGQTQGMGPLAGLIAKPAIHEASRGDQDANGGWLSDRYKGNVGA